MALFAYRLDLAEDALCEMRIVQKQHSDELLVQKTRAGLLGGIYGFFSGIVGATLGGVILFWLKIKP